VNQGVSANRADVHHANAEDVITEGAKNE